MLSKHRKQALEIKNYKEFFKIAGIFSDSVEQLSQGPPVAQRLFQRIFFVPFLKLKIFKIPDTCPVLHPLPSLSLPPFLHPPCPAPSQIRGFFSFVTHIHTSRIHIHKHRDHLVSFVCTVFLAKHLLLDGQLGSFSLRKTNFPLLSLIAHSFPSRGGPYEISLKSQ